MHSGVYFFIKPKCKQILGKIYSLMLHLILEDDMIGTGGSQYN
nr:MAG TPA: hypothetical protein [Caudoviricetes sp.]